MPFCTKCGFCEPVQQVTLPSLISTTRAGRAHAGVRLERPLVLGLDHACGGLERLVDIAGLLAVDLALAHRRLADVVVERGSDPGMAA